MAKEKCEQHSGCDGQIKRNSADIVRLYELVDKVRNRPPVWMSLSFSAAIGVIGYLLKGAV